ncbi:MAG: plastocyanin/azurin family copper-binding protein [Halobacteriales archaeon]
MRRRRLLRTLGTAATAGGLAGCIGGGGGDDTAPTETTGATDTPSPTDASMETASPTPTDGMAAVALEVADQETDSRNVTVPAAVLDDDGWLVVHPPAAGGGPNGGVTLATKRLPAGEYADVELQLDRVLAGSQTVFAMLHYDDPADGEFTFPQNGDPPVTKDGSPVVKPFEVTYTGMTAPSLAVTDQTSDGSAVTVPSLAIDDVGWFVVHPEAEGGGPNGGATLATMPLKAGLYADVLVPLDEPLEGTQTVYGMLHYDDPDDGKFTFPADGDPPVTKDGSPIVKPFEVTVEGGVTESPTASPTPTTTTVEMVNTTFDPERVAVTPGTTVEWVNRDGYGHDVTAAQFHEVAAEWSFSQSVAGGGSTTYTFEEPGVYEYYCSIHGRSQMCGVVLVGDVSLDRDLPCEGTDAGGGGGGGGGGYY